MSKPGVEALSLTLLCSELEGNFCLKLILLIFRDCWKHQLAFCGVKQCQKVSDRFPLAFIQNVYVSLSYIPLTALILMYKHHLEGSQCFSDPLYLHININDMISE